ncbi:MAG TPA: hypothetical protein PKX32_03385 [Candidatus Saccharicenans sp.]|nr:hypothetical protein [Candidatus Saccharicenans sp.]
MISKNEFLEIFKPLRVNFPDVKNEKLQEDYERLNIYSPEILRRTVDYLLENYRGRTYPVFAEIWTALETVCETHQPELKIRNVNEQCQKCHDSGYILEEKYLQYSHHETGQVMRPSRTDTARFCDCEIGRKRKASFLAYWQSKHDVQKAALEARKAWEETR